MVMFHRFALRLSKTSPTTTWRWNPVFRKTSRTFTRWTLRRRSYSRRSGSRRRRRGRCGFKYNLFHLYNYILKLDTSIESSAMHLKWDISRYLPEGPYIRPGKLDTRFFLLLRQGQEGERKVPGIKAGGIQVVHLNKYLTMRYLSAKEQYYFQQAGPPRLAPPSTPSPLPPPAPSTTTDSGSRPSKASNAPWKKSYSKERGRLSLHFLIAFNCISKGAKKQDIKHACMLK